MSAGRPTLSLSRKTPLKSKKSAQSSCSSKKKPHSVPVPVPVGPLPPTQTSASGSCNPGQKPWVDTVNDLNVYKPSKEELESKKAQRKSQNKVLAKVSLSDKRSGLVDPERQRLIEHQVMLDHRQQPSQNVEAILARSEQVMGICQGILNGEMITPTYQPVEQALSGVPALTQGQEHHPGQAQALQAPLQQAPLHLQPQPESEEGVAGPQAQGLDRLRGRPLPPGPPAPGPTPPSEPLVQALGSSGGTSSTAIGYPPAPAPVQPVTNPPYMNSAALNEIAGELLITVRELREELLQEREARERLEREVVQQRELLSELCREVLRLQLHCSGQSLQSQGQPIQPPALGTPRDHNEWANQPNQPHIVKEQGSRSAHQAKEACSRIV